MVDNTRTLFHSAEWPYKDYYQPIHGWSLGEVIKVSSGEATSDYVGKLFYYLEDLFAQFWRQLRSRNISFRLYDQDIQQLATTLEVNAFARIEVCFWLSLAGLHCLALS